MTETVAYNRCCTGCGICSLVCPAQAISMCQNEKGFLAPFVSSTDCIHCGKCVKACHLHADIVFNKPISEIAAKNKSSEERIIGSSGSIFILLAKHIISQKGIVYGAAFDEKNQVKHIRAKTIDDVFRCCQSKYVQSNAVGAIQTALEDIKEGRMIMFVGSPCQVSALRLALQTENIDDTNVLFVDFVCHGTPSPAVFSDYLKMIEEKYSGTIEKFYFRDKAQGWRGNGYKALFLNRKPVINGFYLRGYNKLYPLATNEACFECKYSKPERVSDLTLGDFWGIEQTPVASFEDQLGVSMVLINSVKGEEWFQAINDEIDLEEITIEYCQKNTPLFHSPTKSRNYDDFWNSYLLDGYKACFDHFCKFKGKQGLFERIKWMLMYKMNLKDKVLLLNSRLKQ